MFKKDNPIAKAIKNMTQPNTMDLVTAKAELRNARTKSLNVIDYQLLMIQKNQNNSLHTTQVENAKMSIKSAYYALSVIEVIEAKIDEIAVNSELAQGMNEITHAMKLVNHFHARAEKPKIRKFNKQFNKMAGKSDKSVSDIERVGDAYEAAVSRAVDIDEIVDDNIVSRLMDGEDPMDCLSSDCSINAPFEYDSMAIDFSKIRDDADTHDYNSDLDAEINLDALQD